MVAFCSFCVCILFYSPTQLVQGFGLKLSRRTYSHGVLGRMIFECNYSFNACSPKLTRIIKITYRTFYLCLSYVSSSIFFPAFPRIFSILFFCFTLFCFVTLTIWLFFFFFWEEAHLIGSSMIAVKQLHHFFVRIYYILKNLSI